jgi:restriction endonuclease Mrr
MNEKEMGMEFERIVAELFAAMGYAVERNVIVEGRSGNCEIDVLAEKKKNLRTERAIVECKFKNGGEVERSEVLDWNARVFEIEMDDSCKVDEVYFVTDGRFQPTARNTGNYYGMKLLDGADLNRELKRYGIDAYCRGPRPNFGGPLSELTREIVRYGVKYGPNLSKLLGV